MTVRVLILHTIFCLNSLNLERNGSEYEYDDTDSEHIAILEWRSVEALPVEGCSGASSNFGRVLYRPALMLMIQYQWMVVQMLGCLFGDEQAKISGLFADGSDCLRCGICEHF